MEYVIDLFLHLDVHLAAFVAQYGPWVYAMLFAIIFIETGLVIWPFLPGDSLLFTAGALAATGVLDIYLVSILLVAAAIAGDAVNYSIGRYVGPKVFSAHDYQGLLHKLLNREHLDKAHAFFEKHGGMAVVSGRFVPIVRTFVPFVAGAASMTASTFVTYNVVGAHHLGGGLHRRGLPVRQRADRQGQLLAGRHRHRPRLGAADRDRVSEESRQEDQGRIKAAPLPP